MQGRCTLGNAHLAFTSHDIKLDDECVTIHEVTACGDVDNIIISDDQCHIISGPESVVLRLDYLHINTSLSADIEITAPSNRQCHTQDGNLVIRVNTNAPRQQEATEEQRVMNLHEEFVVGPTNNNNNNNTHTTSLNRSSRTSDHFKTNSASYARTPTPNNNGTHSYHVHTDITPCVYANG